MNLVLASHHICKGTASTQTRVSEPFLEISAASRSPGSIYSHWRQPDLTTAVYCMRGYQQCPVLATPDSSSATAFAKLQVLREVMGGRGREDLDGCDTMDGDGED